MPIVIMERIRKMTAEEFDEFAFNELNSIDNVDLLILRGHIIIEYLLNYYLESISQIDGTDFSKENFSFAQKLKLITHFAPLGSKENNLNKELVLLNKLRNSIAHEFTYNKTQLDEYLIELSKKNPSINTRPTDLKYKLITSLAFISGIIIGSTKELKSKNSKTLNDEG